MLLNGSRPGVGTDGDGAWALQPELLQGLPFTRQFLDYPYLA